MSQSTDDMVTESKAALKSGYEKLQNAGTLMAEHNKANFEAMTEAAKITYKSIEEASAVSMAYAKTATETTMATMKALGTSKSIQEAVELHTDFTRTALDGYFAQLNKVADIYLNAMKASSKPISDRVSASMAAFQSAK